jgi:GT2 family glycosyltransferase
MNVAVIIACHNRVGLTKKAIESLEIYKPEGWKLHYFVCDDGSTDGTAEFLKSLPLKIEILNGTGDLYWAKSMFLAMNEAKSNSTIDSYLLVNDDIELNDRITISNFEKLTREFPKSIVIGQLFDSSRNEISYGGLRRIGRHPFRAELVNAMSHPLQVDTFHANFAFFPASVVEKIGLLDSKYAHGYADFDFGYRAKEIGLQILVNPGYVGICPLNQAENFETFTSLVSFLFSKKGRPLMSQIRFARKFGGVEWPIYVISGYLNPILKQLMKISIKVMRKGFCLKITNQASEKEI